MELPPVVRKVVLAAVSGATVFLVTGLSHQPAFPGLVLSLLVGGIVLLVQFLQDLEHRQSGVEAAVRALTAETAAGPGRTREALRAEASALGAAVRLYHQWDRTPHGTELLTRLADGLARDGVPPLAMQVARAEIAAAADFIDAVSQGREAVSEGEDRDWLVALTRLSSRRIDAISHVSAGPGGEFTDGGFWETELGNHYLELQRDAIRRGVPVRRLFVAPGERLTGHPPWPRWRPSTGRWASRFACST